MTAARRVCVVGGGILGVAVAREVLHRLPDASVTVLEREGELAQHQTGRSSGVVHQGLYYEPGSLKATLCRRGTTLLRAVCDAHGLAYDRCGKVVVALDAVEAVRLDEIERRSLANGVPGLRRLSSAQLREVEPNVVGVAALHSPETAVVDFAAVTRALANEVTAAGGDVRTRSDVVALSPRSAEVVVGTETPVGREAAAYDLVIACAGVQSDRVARLAGDDANPRIVPFRGEYLRLRPERRTLVRGLVYPVPDPALPFLGVHLTKRVDGEVLVGPNAVLALGRQAYAWRSRESLNVRDLAQTLAWPGFARLARTHWRTGVDEVLGSLLRRRFVASAARYVPELTVDDVLPGPSGIRAQALDRSGRLVDDFRITRRGQVVLVRNAPSPGATSSLAIAEHVVSLALDE